MCRDGSKFLRVSAKFTPLELLKYYTQEVFWGITDHSGPASAFCNINKRRNFTKSYKERKILESYDDPSQEKAKSNDNNQKKGKWKIEDIITRKKVLKFITLKDKIIRRKKC